MDKNNDTQKQEYNDFFIAFIRKRRKNYLKKKDKIELLSKKDKKDLKPDQIDLVVNKHLNNEKIQYFNGIIDLYMTAIKKKKPEMLTQTNSSKNNEENILNLFFLGNCMRNCKDKTLQIIEQKKLDVSFQENLQQNFSKVFNSENCTLESRNESVNNLKSYLKNSELTSQINSIVNDKQIFGTTPEPVVEEQEVEQKVEEVQEKNLEEVFETQPIAKVEKTQEPVEEVQKPVDENKPTYFMSSDDEEENNEEIEEQVQEETEELVEDKEEGIKFVPIPSSDEEDTFERRNHKKNKNSIRGRGGRGYKRRGRGGYRGRGGRGRGRGRGRGYRGRGYRGRGRGGYRGRGRNDNENYTKVETTQKNED